MLNAALTETSDLDEYITLRGLQKMVGFEYHFTSFIVDLVDLVDLRWRSVRTKNVEFSVYGYHLAIQCCRRLR